MKRTAFSLVELSIVLVILGLLVGGILAGQSLIRASELRAVTSEHQRYATATLAFRDKYFALPGDMTNATPFWGRMMNLYNCPSNSNASVVAGGTCDGNGDGIISPPTSLIAGGVPSERFIFWHHLMLAGLIEGKLTGRSSTINEFESVVGSNSPPSKMTPAGWSFIPDTGVGGSVSFAGHAGNAFVVGTEYSASATLGPIMSPEEAWNIDTKTDDGRPALGNVMVMWRSPCTNATGVADTAANYKLTNTSRDCAVKFYNSF